MSARMVLCVLDLYLPQAHSLKDKRSIVKSLTQRARQQFNISIAEVAHQDVIQTAQMAIVTVSNQTKHSQQVIAAVVTWIETNFPDVFISRQTIELL